MLPLRDKNPAPITPWVVYGVVGANVTIFLFEYGMGQDRLVQFLYQYGLVPSHVTAALRGEGGLLRQAVIPAFTSMFLHGGWAHLLGNMWFLFVFGDNVEGRLGRLPFLGFYLFCGLAAAAVQYALAPGSDLPTIGASGAIAGVLGAYVVCWPRARVLTLVPLFVLFYFVELPAVVVLGFWIVIQFLQGAASLGVRFAHGGVAYGAHVGGFIIGALLVKALPRRPLTGRERRRRAPFPR
jgi:membrane associated rhomboid family serine protease